MRATVLLCGSFPNFLSIATRKRMIIFFPFFFPLLFLFVYGVCHPGGDVSACLLAAGVRLYINELQHGSCTINPDTIVSHREAGNHLPADESITSVDTAAVCVEAFTDPCPRGVVPR